MSPLMRVAHGWPLSLSLSRSDPLWLGLNTPERLPIEGPLKSSHLLDKTLPPVGVMFSNSAPMCFE